MRGPPPKSEGTPLGCFLKNWKLFKLDGLRKEKLKFFCNTYCLLYNLGDGERWPQNGSVNYHTILQLDCSCCRLEQWTEVPCVQAFMSLYWSLALCSSEAWGTREFSQHSRRSSFNFPQLSMGKFIERSDIEAETPIHWPPDGKNWLIWKDSDAGKDWGQEEKGMTEDEMVGWHHWLNGHEFG